MSYLDKPLTRESYNEHISNKSRSLKVNSRIALDWFDKFCVGKYDGKNESVILKDLLDIKFKNPQKYSNNILGLLQDFVNYLDKNGQDPATVRVNFNLVKNYLNWYGFGIYNEDVKTRLNFKKKIEEEAYPLSVEDIKLLLHHATASRRALYLVLSSSGMRITETLLLRKRDLDFSNERITIVLKGKYTKTKKPRRTFISKEAETYLKPILDKIKDDDLVFGINEDPLLSKHSEEEYFARLRDRAGLTDRYDTGRHKISLHSFRSFFITKCNRIDSDFGNSLAGHARYMKRYDRLTDKEKLELYLKAEPTLSIYENFDTTEYEQMLNEQKTKNQELEERMKLYEESQVELKRAIMMISKGHATLTDIDEEGIHLRMTKKSTIPPEKRTKENYYDI